MSDQLTAARHSVNEVASLCNVHVATVWRWILRGVRERRLRSIRIGGRRFVLQSDLDRFLEDENEYAGSEVAIAQKAAIAERTLDSRGIKAR